MLNKLLLCENSLSFNEATTYRLIFNMIAFKYLFRIDLLLEFTLKKMLFYKRSLKS